MMSRSRAYLSPSLSGISLFFWGARELGIASHALFIGFSIGRVVVMAFLNDSIGTHTTAGPTGGVHLIVLKRFSWWPCLSISVQTSLLSNCHHLFFFLFVRRPLFISFIIEWVLWVRRVCACVCEIDEMNNSEPVLKGEVEVNKSIDAEFVRPCGISLSRSAKSHHLVVHISLFLFFSFVQTYSYTYTGSKKIWLSTSLSDLFSTVSLACQNTFIF